MKIPSKVDVIKDNMKDKKGREIKFVVRRGKSRKIIQNGIISDVYPSIFTIQTDKSHLSFSYIDVLTKTIELAFLN